MEFNQINLIIDCSEFWNYFWKRNIRRPQISQVQPVPLSRPPFPTTCAHKATSGLDTNLVVYQAEPRFTAVNPKLHNEKLG